ncbi:MULTISPECIES: Cof-type HAD-IIB family hydrolase [Enterococcus]|uniref:HAD family phosphatase n=1 Tax=Candidatus Enterococcus murrayae TaxID=2815321 RepID=A0ABS3HLE3_9ENTE|nr:HAD family hydrolase [Enterococcus sp. MJM16]MBO0454261.1 HAD family phosphatase [Enterococcus sp. MJM16]
MEKHLIFMDIDGTLVARDQKISERTKSVVKELQQDGHQFYVATGRKYSSAFEMARKLSDDTQVIASNGSVYTVNEMLHKKRLSDEALRFVYQTTTDYQLPMFFFGEHTIFYTQQLPSYLQKNDQSRIGNDEEDFCSIDSMETLMEVSQRIVNGIIIADDQEDKLKEVREILAKSGLLSVSSSHPNNIELIPLGVNKATAIHAVRKELTVPQKNIISFGDGMNDLEMLQASGIGVAMGNAVDELKQHAQYVTNTNVEDGIANFLLDYFK